MSEHQRFTRRAPNLRLLKVCQFVLLLLAELVLFFSLFFKLSLLVLGVSLLLRKQLPDGVPRTGAGGVNDRTELEGEAGLLNRHIVRWIDR